MTIVGLELRKYKQKLIKNSSLRKTNMIKKLVTIRFQCLQPEENRPWWTTLSQKSNMHMLLSVQCSAKIWSWNHMLAMDGVLVILSWNACQEQCVKRNELKLRENISSDSIQRLPHHAIQKTSIGQILVTEENIVLLWLWLIGLLPCFWLQHQSHW